MIKMSSAFQVSECVRRLTRRETETTLLARPSATVELLDGVSNRAAVADIDSDVTGHFALWGLA